MAAMGLFDVKGLTEIDPSFQLAGPLFDKITIQLNRDYYRGDQFVIETRNNSKENIYIESLKLNENEHSSIHLDYSDVVKGGKIVVVLTDKPSLELN